MVQKLLIIIGLLFIVIGLLYPFFRDIGFGNKFFYTKPPLSTILPGDIVIKKENSSFYFPIVTCIVVSVVISLILIFLKKMK